MQKLFGLCLFVIAVSSTCQAQQPAGSELVVDETFAKPLDSKVWKPNFGHWRVESGVLKGAERDQDNHAAALRRVVSSKNAVYELKFRFTDKGQAFHFGFDPAKGELDKKGHLFSLVVTPESWKILKHADKNNPREKPNQALSESKRAFQTGQWYSLRVTTWNQYVTAVIDQGEKLTASDPSFSVSKPTLIFRCVGDGIEISDVKVYRQVK